MTSFVLSAFYHLSNGLPVRQNTTQPKFIRKKGTAVLRCDIDTDFPQFPELPGGLLFFEKARFKPRHCYRIAELPSP
jgi:hypothetical protein